MTKEEAIDILQEDIAINKHLIDTLPSAAAETFKNDILAYNMAIKALEKQPTVINEIPKDYKYDTETKDFLVYRHKYTGDEIHIEKPIPLYTLEQSPCEDCISRQAVLDQAVDYGSNTYLIPVNSVKTLPPVILKEKTGKWILTDVEGNRVWHCNCSECGKDPQDYIGGSENWWMIKNKLPKYCPSCGKRIQEVENGKYNKTYYH